MGYTTEFYGRVDIDPPLGDPERDYLTRFAATRRMERKAGPYYVEGSGFRGHGHDSDVRDFSQPPRGQPGLWCQWVPSEDGAALKWDGGEKFYEADRWMAYLIDHFLRPAALASATDDPHFEFFTFDHNLNGEIEAQGEEYDDRWLLRVEHNRVTVLRGHLIYHDPVPVDPHSARP
jgi:hypothetical protein